MRKNKKLYKIVIVLVILLCICLVISFTHNNKKTNEKTEIIDIKCEGDNSETNNIPKDTDDNKPDTNESGLSNGETSNNGVGNGGSGTNSNDDTTTGTVPVITDGDGDTTIPDENGNIEETRDSLSVSDKYQTWSNTTKIRIFDVSQIAPGDSGTYDFAVNNNTDGNVNYSIVFEEENAANVNMLYKLKRNDEYIAGNEETWVKYNELNIEDIILNKYNMDSYYIEWKWIDADNDTEAGRTPGAKYKLTVTVKAKETADFDKYSKASLNPDTGDKLLHYIELALLSLIVLILLIIKRRQKD